MSSVMSQLEHIPVMISELVSGLGIVPGGRYVDGTVGAGGHARAVLEASAPGGRLLGLDADPEAIRLAEANLHDLSGSFALVNANFSTLESVCKTYRFADADGLYLDLGLSSMQLEEPQRGFSFQRDEALDMRFNPAQQLTAADIVNKLPEEELARVLWLYGEERRSRAIARRIVQRRPIATTGELARLVRSAYPPKRYRTHPATKTFQALRIKVNDELANLEEVLRAAVRVVRPGGRLAVMSYHSLEDRIVKRFFQEESKDCICPPRLPVCACSHRASLRVVNRRVITPSEDEVQRNPRSRSAKLRVAERVDGSG